MVTSRPFVVGQMKGAPIAVFMPVGCGPWAPGELPRGPGRKLGAVPLLTLCTGWESICLAGQAGDQVFGMHS